MKNVLALSLLGFMFGCQGDLSFANTKQDPGTTIGNGKIEVSPTSMEFTGLTPKYPRSDYLLLKSVGDDTLYIYDLKVVAGSANFQTERLEDVTIATGDQYEVAVTATLPDWNKASGTLRIETNDPDQLQIDVPLTALPGSPDTGDTGDTGT